MAITFLHKLANVLTATNASGFKLQRAGEYPPNQGPPHTDLVTRNNIVQASHLLESSTPMSGSGSLFTSSPLHKPSLFLSPPQRQFRLQPCTAAPAKFRLNIRGVTFRPFDFHRYFPLSSIPFYPHEEIVI